MSLSGVTEKDGAATVSPERLAAESLGLLRAFAALAERSLEVTAPELTLQQYRALTVLHEEGPQKAAALAAALGIAPSTLTRLGNRLVRDGLADRGGDPDDRRAIVLAATPEGSRTAERVKAWRLGEMTRRIADVPPHARHAVLAALELCSEVLAAEPQGSAFRAGH